MQCVVASKFAIENLISRSPSLSLMYSTQYTFCTRASALNGVEWDGTTGKFGGGSELGPTWRTRARRGTTPTGWSELED